MENMDIMDKEANKVHDWDDFEPFLFPASEMVGEGWGVGSSTTTSKGVYEDNGPLNIEWIRDLSFTGKYQMPKVKAYEGDLPQFLIPFYRLGNAQTVSGVCPCFYTVDSNFEKAWRRPREFVKTLMPYDFVLSPDYSVYLDFPRHIQTGNIFRNKALAAKWQKHGIPVIPSVSWTNVKHIEEDLEGWPIHSVIAINSTGLGRDKRAKHNWLKGYEATMDILKPTAILRYGAPQKGERREISRYYPNCNGINVKGIIHGR